MSTKGAMWASTDVKEVSNSPAFMFLDDLGRRGQLSAAQIQMFKNKYQQLHETVMATYSNESALLSAAKNLHGRYKERSQELEKAMTTSRHIETTLEQLKKQQAASQHELSEIEDGRNMVRFEQEELERRKAEAIDVLEERRAHYMDEIAPEVAQLKEEIQDLEAEIKAQRESHDKEVNSTQEYMDQISETTSRIAAAERNKHHRRVELNQVLGDPDRLRADANVVSKSLKEYEARAQSLQDEISKYEADMERQRQERKEAEQDSDKLNLFMDQLLKAITQREQHIAEIEKQLDEEHHRSTVALERRAQIELEKKEARMVIHNEQEALKVYVKETDKQKRRQEKLRRKRDTMVGVLPGLVRQQELLHRQVEDLKQSVRQQKKTLVEFKQEEELFISQFLQQEKVEEETSEMLRAVERECGELEDKMKTLEHDERMLKKRVSELEAAREVLARSASQATSAYREEREAAKVKQLILMDLDKQTAEASSRLENCTALYEKVKNQRNKFANLNQTSAQALAEMREKIKILNNEVEILRNESTARDRVLAEEVRVRQQAIAARDGSRVEQNKLQNQDARKRQAKNKNLVEIEKLNAIVNAAEREMMRLRKAYSQAVDARNLTGIQLIDRNDELSILYEKYSIQESIIKKGHEEMHKREEEIRFIDLDIAEVRRRIDMGRKKMPKQGDYAQLRKRLKELENRLNDERKRAQQLATKLEAPLPLSTAAAGGGGGGAAAATTTGASAGSDVEHKSADSGGAAAANDGGVSAPDRARVLQGHDPEPEQLAAKIEVLEERLNDKKEQLLEKELVLDEVTSLSDKLRAQAAESRGSTLDLAKRVNEYQAKIRTATRKMMAAVSELSMYQATALKLEQERKDREVQLQEARERLNRGEPPTDDARHEWYRKERDRVRRHQAMLKRAMDAEAQANADPNAITTTAETRHTMYLDEETGLPKPYGNLAPFKPSSVGAQIRHYRNPVVKDIEI
eukprot:TRINITY_DN21046_c0_g1_i1.p1 TRINITY_DN21046_c0_g1~~TRINITY_DN21046_c0_g1_i1.p1  ORF type:complete len:990 (+),score=582.58 TRINITY_DN21046_c0_g1_i1:36-2972(+)